MSDGSSIQHRRITKPDFRPSSTCVSRCQAPFCLCTLPRDFHPRRGNLWAPPLPFGRRPPQSNCPPDTVPKPVHGLWLELQYKKGGIPTSAPPELASRLPCLPPILYILYQSPMSGCSKAPRGLSVLSQVTRIFTGITISPSPSSRQCPNRYAFRAGRNLPDKEFRYLRTVIVTAAVYWGFGSELRVTPNPSP